MDGRRERSRRSRERILDGLERALREEGGGPVTGEAIVARAGVSMSTLFRHFGDVDGVAKAMRERMLAGVAPIALAPFEGDARARLADLVERRGRIFERIGPLRRAAQRGVQGGQGPSAEDEQGLMTLVRAALPEELAACDPDVAELVQALLSFETWNRLRTVQGLDAERAARILEDETARLLGLD